MNFTQMHERLRTELLRRIDRGTLTVSLLARQTGFGVSHVSGFLHSRKQLSLAALDRMLSSQHMAIADLLPASAVPTQTDLEGQTAVPVVSHAAAMYEPVIRSNVVQRMLPVPSDALSHLRARCTPKRRDWQRFVAVHISAMEAIAMDPLVLPDAMAILDRHYNLMIPFRPHRPNVYAVRDGTHLTLRYASQFAERLVLRPINFAAPVHLVEAGPDKSPSELIAGRVALIVNRT